MSEFSDRCKQLLLESGSNVYQISKRSSLDRTTIQRMITGKRLPSEQFVTDFCTYLRISPLEKSELLELYKMEKVGKTAYLNRWFVKNLIETLSSVEENFPVSRMKAFLYKHPHEYHLHHIMQVDQATIHEHVEDTILTILEHELQNNENPEILLNIPSGYLFLFHMLQRDLKTAPPQTRIKHLVTLNKNAMNVTHSLKNLETLLYILPLAKTLNEKYQPYYMYSNLTPDDEKLLVMPYCIITSEHLLIISSDFKSVSLHTSEPIVEQYRSEFQRIFNMTEPLIKYAASPAEVLSHMTQAYQTLGKPSHSFEFHPCFAYMCSTFQLPDTFTNTLSNVSELAPLFQEMFRPLIDSDTVSTNFFSEDGLKVFASTGKCLGQYSNIEEGFSPTDRKLMLNQYCNRNLKDEFHGYMLKPTFKIPTYINIELHDTHCLHLISLKENFECSFIEIEESSICEAFYDFFESLPNSELAYTKEETNVKMADYISLI